MHEIFLAPSGHLTLADSSGDGGVSLAPAIATAFEEGSAHGLLHLAAKELQSSLPPALDFARSFASAYLARLCQTQGHESTSDLPPTPAPSEGELAAWVLQAPPMP